MDKLFWTSDHTALYAKYRPKSPPIIAQKTLNFMKDMGTSFECLVDVGCGSGQSTEIFAGYFKKVVGLDISPNQIWWARKGNKFNNIDFQVGSCDNIPVPDKSVDLVTCAHAAHWFDLDEFFKECKRILKPNGCLMLRCSELPYMYPVKSTSEGLRKYDDDLAKLGQSLSREFYGKCKFSERLSYCEDHYSTIFSMLPCRHKIHEDNIFVKIESSLKDFRNHC